MLSSKGRGDQPLSTQMINSTFLLRTWHCCDNSIRFRVPEIIMTLLNLSVFFSIFAPYIHFLLSLF